ncbi:KTSC domain-containing protein [Methyloligella sp. 2.7D]|uniref:KTSC domain-containing protein n=1 Tax=unclassified Methyloligella TaxID=2625955 RepID=UPI00157DB217|nr:KTSC domain-containing protein [Methyloligella sp. GL2]QKP77863.1 KTSC domain-containing protein [Methyloligella sp. GL2]
MPYVNSGSIVHVEHDAQSSELRITFRDAGTYSFHGVSGAVYQAFLEAPSQGRFYNDHIRQNYPSTFQGDVLEPLAAAPSFAT